MEPVADTTRFSTVGPVVGRRLGAAEVPNTDNPGATLLPTEPSYM